MKPALHLETTTSLKKPLAAGVIASLALVLCAPIDAQADTSNIPVSATILPPITLSQPAAMRFGSIAPSGSAGTVTLALPAALSASPPTTASPVIIGTRTQTGGVTLLGGGTCSALVLCGAGSVQVNGPLSGTFSSVTLPASVTLTSGLDSMIVNNLVVRYGAPGTSGATTGLSSFNASGLAVVLMTGRLDVAASQPAGTYTGTMVVTVDY
jgi:hypothetical protein